MRGRGPHARQPDGGKQFTWAKSFVAAYEEGGSCNKIFTPVANGVAWSSAEATIVAVDSLSGQVTGKQIGDALVVPSLYGTIAPLSVLVHVR